MQKDTVENTDPVVGYAVVAAMEALLSAGIVDAYELYQYVHVSEVGLGVGTQPGLLKTSGRLASPHDHTTARQHDTRHANYTQHGCCCFCFVRQKT